MNTKKDPYYMVPAHTATYRVRCHICGKNLRGTEKLSLTRDGEFLTKSRFVYCSKGCCREQAKHCDYNLVEEYNLVKENKERKDMLVELFKIKVDEDGKIVEMLDSEIVVAKNINDAILTKVSKDQVNIAGGEKVVAREVITVSI